MPSLSAGQTASLVLAPGDSYTISTSGVATVKAIYGAPTGTTTLTANWQKFGPYGVPAKLDVTASSGNVIYSLDSPGVPIYAQDDGTFTVDGEVVNLGGGSELPYDTVSLTATTAAIRSGACQVAGLSCSASTSLNVTIYANSVNSGTVIWSGALTAGQVVTLPAPYSSFIGLSAQIVSGSGTFVLYVK